MDSEIPWEKQRAKLKLPQYFKCGGFLSNTRAPPQSILFVIFVINNNIEDNSAKKKYLSFEDIRLLLLFKIHLKLSGKIFEIFCLVTDYKNRNDFRVSCCNVKNISCDKCIIEH